MADAKILIVEDEGIEALDIPDFPAQGLAFLYPRNW